MIKKVYSVALFAVLATMAVSCQKENGMDFASETTVAEASTVYTVQYSVNGVLHKETLHNEGEYNSLLMQLMALSREGAVVEISDNNYSPSVLPSKESVTYTTSSDEAAAVWVRQKAGEGYRVRVTYDTANNVHICVAYK
ncbi:MAG: hypothetical protein MJZ76_10030 [Bacteroidales bacterium]|nr:hypothetical protein [Bacteroidales bacterium]